MWNYDLGSHPDTPKPIKSWEIPTHNGSGSIQMDNILIPPSCPDEKLAGLKRPGSFDFRGANGSFVTYAPKEVIDLQDDPSKSENKWITVMYGGHQAGLSEDDVNGEVKFVLSGDPKKGAKVLDTISNFYYDDDGKGFKFGDLDPRCVTYLLANIDNIKQHITVTKQQVITDAA